MVALAAQVRRLRDARGWSAQRLADELAAIGVPLDRSVIANLENGRRASVDVQELLALALAFGVTPAALLVDLDADQVDVTPTTRATPLELLLWLQGRVPLKGHDAAIPHRAAGAVARYATALTRVRSRERYHHDIGETEVSEKDREALNMAQAELRQATVDLRALGVTAPDDTMA